MVVICRYPAYIELGKQLNARVFNITQSTWEKMSPELRWIVNREFLDEAMAGREQIILATDPAKVLPGSTLEMELDYLASYGYLPRLIGDRWEVFK